MALVVCFALYQNTCFVIQQVFSRIVSGTRQNAGSPYGGVKALPLGGVSDVISSSP